MGNCKKSLAAKTGKVHKKNTGNVFCTFLQDTKKALGKHYKGYVEKGAGEGNPDAFLECFHQVKNVLPKSALEVTL